jgi:hypothetical protein
LHVRTERRDRDTIAAAIQDNGPGIDPNVLGRHIWRVRYDKNTWNGIGTGDLPAATEASAQEVNPSGPYQCVVNCAGPGPATVTRNGWDLNLVNEIGVPSRAWVDWPGHIWVQSWNEGAIFSPDGMTIQFDRGTVWHRILPQPVLQSGG